MTWWPLFRLALCLPVKGHTPGQAPRSEEFPTLSGREYFDRNCPARMPPGQPGLALSTNQHLPATGPGFPNSYRLSAISGALLPGRPEADLSQQSFHCDHQTYQTSAARRRGRMRLRSPGRTGHSPSQPPGGGVKELNRAAPQRERPAVFRVARVHPWALAVAASKPSITGSGSGTLIRPHSSAASASMGTM